MSSDDVRGVLAGTGSDHGIASAVAAPRLARVSPAGVVLGAAVVASVLGVLAVLGGSNAILFDDLQELAASGGGALGLAVAARWRRPVGRVVPGLALTLSGAFIGMLAWDVSHRAGANVSAAGDIVFVASVCLGVAVVVPAIFGGIPRDRLIGVAIDTLILLLAGVTVVAAIWRMSAEEPGDRAASLGAVILVAASAGCAFGLVARRISGAGPWTLLVGATTLGAAWLMWIGGWAAPSTVDPSDFMFSAGMILIAAGGVGWDARQSRSPAFGRIAVVFNSLLPVGAILCSLALLGLTRGPVADDLLGLSASAVIVASAVRQLHLYSSESRVHASLAESSRRLMSTVDALELEIAERKRLEAEREAMQARLIENQRLESIGRLAGGVAHDFNNLLTAIRGYADLAGLRLAGDDEGQRDIDAVRHAADQAAQLTRQLLAFSRNQALRPSVVDLGAVITGAEPLLRRLLGERVTLVVRTTDGLWPVLVDPSQLESVIVNLSVNARDAMESGGRLTIETANVILDEAYARTHAEVVPGPYAMVAVSDTGAGMDAATLARIFEPFFTTKGPGQGTGLGLATVYGTIRQSGGHISVYSEVGHGTTFKIYLPRTEVHEPDAGAAVPPEPRAGRETILVAEDEEFVRDMIVSALERQGYIVLAVRTGEEALEAIDRHPSDIGMLLTDVVMPGISGLALVEQARLRRPGLRAICMSGYTPLSLRDGGTPEDVRFLGKPFTLTALDEAIRETLDR